VKKDLDYIARLEKAIKDKYGEAAVENPAKYWDEEKEKDYLQQLKQHVEKQKSQEASTAFENVDGVLISRKLIKTERNLICGVCSSKLSTAKDDIYSLKFDCCEKCYIQYIEHREERWLDGWRPKNVTRKL